MNAEQSQEGEKNPRDRVVDGACDEPLVSGPIHRRNEEQVHDPANQKQPEGEEPDGTRHRLTVVKPMRAGETKEPEQVADDFAVGVGPRVHVGRERSCLEPWGQLQRCGLFVAPMVVLM